MGVVDVVRLWPDDWERCRAIRLDALREAPYAFGSTFAREEAFEESDWRARLARSGAVTFVARLPELDGTDAGMTGTFFDEDNKTYELVAVWVRPEARGHGVADALVSATLDWIADAGGDSVHLWVTETNQPARRLYERRGFSYTGERAALPSDPTLTELGMVRSL